RYRNIAETLRNGKKRGRSSFPVEFVVRPRAESMRCYCCDAVIRLARKVKLRSGRFEPDCFPPASWGAYLAYVEEFTFRWAIVCLPCYRQLDVVPAVAGIAGRAFNMAGCSCNDKAAIVDEAKYQAFQRKEAAK